jgi:GT2 family glycosyltransferase
MTRPEVSVLLTSWNTVDDTRRCLASLRETAGDIDYEVIAVDNASSGRLGRRARCRPSGAAHPQP